MWTLILLRNNLSPCYDLFCVLLLLLLLLFPFLSLLPYFKGLFLVIAPISTIPCNFHLRTVSSNSTSLTWVFFFNPYFLARVLFSAYVTIQSLFIISKNLFYADPVSLSVSVSFLTLIIVFSLLQTFPGSLQVSQIPHRWQTFWIYTVGCWMLLIFLSFVERDWPLWGLS